MSKRKDVIRLNDHVRIVNPEVFVRCGYPWSRQYVLENIITKEQKIAVWEMMKAFGFINPESKYYENDSDMLTGMGMSGYDADGYVILDQILYHVAGHVLKKHRWGGKERRIFTEREEGLLNKEARVSDRKVVKTGNYNSAGSGRCGYGYDGEDYDYEPAYLDNEETHVIYTLTMHYYDGMVHTREIKIEKKNLVKLTDEECETRGYLIYNNPKYEFKH